MLSELDASAFAAQDVIALLLGDKPAAYNEATDEQLAVLPRWAAGLGLHCAVLGRVRPDAKTGAHGVLLGKEKSVVERTAKRWSFRAAAMGRLLGYPPCCVAAYVERNRREASDPASDLVPLIARASGAGPYPFLLNNLLLLSSRRCFSGERDAVGRLLRANEARGLPLKLKAVATWHPCSYKCAPSRKAARRIWDYMKRAAPEQSEALKQRLDKPALFLGWSQFAAFEGRVFRGRLEYAGIVPPRSLLAAGALELLGRGDRLALVAGGVSVKRGAREAGFLPCESPVLLPFSDRL